MGRSAVPGNCPKVFLWTTVSQSDGRCLGKSPRVPYPPPAARSSPGADRTRTIATGTKQDGASLCTDRPIARVRLSPGVRPATNHRPFRKSDGDPCSRGSGAQYHGVSFSATALAPTCGQLALPRSASAALGPAMVRSPARHARRPPIEQCGRVSPQT